MIRGLMLAVLVLVLAGAASAQTFVCSGEIGSTEKRWNAPPAGCDLAELITTSREWAMLSMRRSYLDGAGGPFMTWEDRLRTEADLVANKTRAEWAWRQAVEACK